MATAIFTVRKQFIQRVIINTVNRIQTGVCKLQRNPVQTRYDYLLCGHRGSPRVHIILYEGVGEGVGARVLQCVIVTCDIGFLLSLRRRRTIRDGRDDKGKRHTKAAGFRRRDCCSYVYPHRCRCYAGDDPTDVGRYSEDDLWGVGYTICVL